MSTRAGVNSFFSMSAMQETVAGTSPWSAQCDALYREHAPRLVRLCRLLLDDPQEAQEVAQEVFVKVLDTAPGLDRPMAWGPWLTRVTVNACHDRRRAGWWAWWRTRHDALETLEVVDPDPTPEGAALSGELRAQIWGAFRQLPRRQREVFALRHLEGWPTTDVAEALGLTPGSVKRHLFRAIRRLRAALGARG